MASRLTSNVYSFRKFILFIKSAPTIVIVLFAADPTQQKRTSMEL